MTDNPGTRTETDLDRLRREAFVNEARALKEAALDHFKQQTSAELTGLKTALAGEIKTAVREAMTDQAVREALRKELTEQVLGRVSADLAQQIGDRLATEVRQAEARVVEEVQGDFLKSWTKVAKKVFEDGLKSARAEFSRDQEDYAVDAKARLDLRLNGRAEKRRTDEEKAQTKGAETREADQNGKTGESGERSGSPKGFFTGILKGFKNTSRGDRVGVAILLLGFGFVLYVGWSTYAQWRLRSDQNDLDTTPAPAPAPAPMPTPTPPPVSDRLLKDWTRTVEDAETKLQANSPLNPLHAVFKKHPFNEQFLCWFSSDAKKELENLAWKRSPDKLRDQLDRAFEGCFSSNSSLGDPRLAIFSAQATVKEVFSRHRKDWHDWCASGDEAQPVAGLIADGVYGLTSKVNMNVFLTCSGHSAELTIDDNSKTPQYLYVTYLALWELQRP